MVAGRWQQSSTSASNWSVRFGAFRRDLDQGQRKHRLQRCASAAASSRALVTRPVLYLGAEGSPLRHDLDQSVIRHATERLGHRGATHAVLFGQ